MYSLETYVSCRRGGEMSDKIREEFELYAKNNFICSEDSFKRTNTGVYYNYVYSKLDNSDSCSVNAIWKVWQASRNATKVELPATCNRALIFEDGSMEHDEYFEVDDIKDALTAAGISYE